jgi:hypothetical protein
MRGRGRGEKAPANCLRPLAEWLWHEAALQHPTAQPRKGCRTAPRIPQPARQYVTPARRSFHHTHATAEPTRAKVDPHTRLLVEPPCRIASLPHTPSRVFSFSLNHNCERCAGCQYPEAQMHAPLTVRRRARGMHTTTSAACAVSSPCPWSACPGRPDATSWVCPHPPTSRRSSPAPVDAPQCRARFPAHNRSGTTREGLRRHPHAYLLRGPEGPDTAARSLVPRRLRRNPTGAHAWRGRGRGRSMAYMGRSRAVLERAEGVSSGPRDRKMVKHVLTNGNTGYSCADRVVRGGSEGGQEGQDIV